MKLFNDAATLLPGYIQGWRDYFEDGKAELKRAHFKTFLLRVIQNVL